MHSWEGSFLCSANPALSEMRESLCGPWTKWHQRNLMSPTVHLFPLDSRAVNHLSTPCGGDILWCWISLHTSLFKAYRFILSQRLWFHCQGKGFVMLKLENIKSNVSPYYICTVGYTTLCLFPLCLYSIPYVSMSSKIGCFHLETTSVEYPIFCSMLSNLDRPPDQSSTCFL